MNKALHDYFSKLGRKGGTKSRRTLDHKTAREMVLVREARKAYRRFHAQCFWSYDPEYIITKNDLAWVADRLKRNGGRDAWETSARLCR